jgi:hypothetical protein
MVDSPCVFVLGVLPGFDHFEDEESVFVDERRVLDLAFEIDEALGDERGADQLRLDLGETEGSKFVMSRPELLPISTTFPASSTAGIAITHSRVAHKAA